MSCRVSGVDGKYFFRRASFGGLENPLQSQPEAIVHLYQEQ